MTGKQSQIDLRLTKVFRETFNDNFLDIHFEMTADDLDEWDSVSHINLILGVEEEFGISLNPAEILELENVGAMITLLEARAKL